MGTSTNNATVIQQSTQRITALQKHVSARGEIPIAGKKVKGAALVALYQSVLDAGEAVTSAKGNYKLALTARQQAEAQRKIADESLRQWVLITFGAESQEAHDFGFVPKPRAVPSADEKATAAALGKATRRARGTLGKRQKSKIKGTLATPAATPAVLAPAPVAPATAAPVVTASSPVTVEPHA
jgi:hypothetical protein